MSSNKKISIVSFEGLDNTFKETNAHLFADVLKDTFAFEVDGLYFQSFPRYNSKYSFLIKSKLDKENIDFDKSVFKRKDVVKTGFLIDRLTYWNENILPRTDEYKGTIVTRLDLLRSNKCTFVFDRYNFSNIIYSNTVNELSVNKNLKKWLTEERELYGIPSPDVMICMYPSNYKSYMELLESKKYKDSNEDNKTFITTVYKSYKYLLTERLDFLKKYYCKNIIVVDIFDKNGKIRSKEEIFSDIMREVFYTKIKEGK